MKRSSARFVPAALFALFAGCVALPALAQDRSGVVGVERPGPAVSDDTAGLARFLLCLRILDLSPAEKAEIQTILDASRPTLQADRDGIAAAAQKLRSDIDAGADKCQIGQDALDLRAAELKLAADVLSVETQIQATLTDAQKLRLRGCIEAPHPTAAGSGREDVSR